MTFWQRIEVPVVRFLCLVLCIIVWFFIWQFGKFAIDQYREILRIERELNEIRERAKYMDSMIVEENGSVTLTWRE